MSTAKTPPAAKTMLATRDFTDAGTGKSFLANNAVEAEPGEMANYAAAGLVTADEQPAAKTAA
jgi:hypothetical protein